MSTWFKREFIDKIELRTHKDYPGETFGVIGNTNYFEYLGSEKRELWYSYYKFWPIFFDQFHMEEVDINRFMKDQVWEHYKWRVDTTNSRVFLLPVKGSRY